MKILLHFYFFKLFSHHKNSVAEFPLRLREMVIKWCIVLAFFQMGKVTVSLPSSRTEEASKVEPTLGVKRKRADTSQPSGSGLNSENTQSNKLRKKAFKKMKKDRKRAGMKSFSHIAFTNFQVIINFKQLWSKISLLFYQLYFKRNSVADSFLSFYRFSSHTDSMSPCLLCESSFCIWILALIF